jgi:predicted nuclease of predicted toxin-antitoxin system
MVDSADVGTPGPTPKQIKFYTDSHIAMAVVEQLRNRGVDIIHCAEINMENAADTEHFEYATAEGRTVITCDRDFLVLNEVWLDQGKNHAGIVFVRPQSQGNIGRMVKYLFTLYQRVTANADILQNEVHNMVQYLS